MKIRNRGDLLKVIDAILPAMQLWAIPPAKAAGSHVGRGRRGWNGWKNANYFCGTYLSANKSFKRTVRSLIFRHGVHTSCALGFTKLCHSSRQVTGSNWLCQVNVIAEGQCLFTISSARICCQRNGRKTLVGIFTFESTQFPDQDVAVFLRHPDIGNDDIWLVPLDGVQCLSSG